MNSSHANPSPSKNKVKIVHVFVGGVGRRFGFISSLTGLIYTIFLFQLRRLPGIWKRFLLKFFRSPSRGTQSPPDDQNAKKKFIIFLMWLLLLVSVTVIFCIIRTDAYRPGERSGGVRVPVTFGKEINCFEWNINR